jgi:hypothetical protein
MLSISAELQTNLIDQFCGFSEPFQANAVIVRSSRSLPLPKFVSVRHALSSSRVSTCGITCDVQTKSLNT